jgi:hypothetical protein
MMPALSVSVAGLLDASNRLSTSATRIVKQSSVSFDALARSGESSSEVAPKTSAPRSLSPNDLSEAPSPGTSLYTPSYAEDIISMKMASAAYKANAKMIKASNEMTQELLETLR